MGLNVHIGDRHYQFDGPHTTTGSLLSQSGVYVISTIVDGYHKVLDVGESHDIRHRIENHDRKDSWQRHINDTLYVSALYYSSIDRMLVESTIRQFHNPPCGIR